jgi:succinyl-CoA synthetase alpha subunit
MLRRLYVYPLPHSLTSQRGRTHAEQERSAAHAQQRRAYHTTRFPRRPQLTTSVSNLHQKRSLHLDAAQSATLLKSYDIHVADKPSTEESTHYLGISPARSARSPSILVAPTTNPSQLSHRVRRIPFDYRTGPTPSAIEVALAHLQLDAAPPKAKAQTVSLIHNLWALYTQNEAVDAHLHLSVSSTSDALSVSSPYLFLDDAAFKSAGRHTALHSARSDTLTPTEREAEQSGIVYIPLSTPQPDSRLPPSTSTTTPARNTIGTLVNGAGLAMNTNDVLHLRLSRGPLGATSTNFLDTGGKATAQTIATSFSLILRDERVRVVFVNIFGGLTLCDMIAQGIVLAFRDVEVRVPVVVRLRGTNEEAGMRVLREARLPIFAVEDFEEAVRKVGELAAREG